MKPQEPIRADHRFLSKFIKMALGNKVEHIPSEFDRISRVFSKLGGSWERLFHGSSKDVNLLRRIIKTALKNGYVSKKWRW